PTYLLLAHRLPSIPLRRLALWQARHVRDRGLCDQPHPFSPSKHRTEHVTLQVRRAYGKSILEPPGTVADQVIRLHVADALPSNRGKHPMERRGHVDDVLGTRPRCKVGEVDIPDLGQRPRLTVLGGETADLGVSRSDDLDPRTLGNPLVPRE